MLKNRFSIVISELAEKYVNKDSLDTDNELLAAIRTSISSEYDAVELYMKIFDMTDDPEVKKLMKDIADEELVHVGEFNKLLMKLSPDDKKFYEEGQKEAKEKIESSEELEKEEEVTDKLDEAKRGRLVGYQCPCGYSTRGYENYEPYKCPRCGAELKNIEKDEATHGEVPFDTFDKRLNEEIDSFKADFYKKLYEVASQGIFEIDSVLDMNIYKDDQKIEEIRNLVKDTKNKMKKILHPNYPK